MSIKQKIIFVLLLLVLCVRPLMTVYHQRIKFFTPGYEKRFSSLNQAYNNSQYHKKKNPISMSDSDFEQFAGGLFLKGLNPILIVHDHPPLGRYVVSLSILLFDNPHTVMLPVMLLNAIGMLLLSYWVLKNPFLALIPFGIFINEPMFINRLIETPLPEPIQLPFILFAFLFFLIGLARKNDLPWFMLTSIMIGGVISTRFFVLGAAMTGSMGLYLLMTHRLGKKSIRFVVTLPLALVVLFLSYFRTIQSGYSLLQIISIQKYILAYHKSKFVLPFTVWDLLLFNRWHTWWADRKILSDPEWTLLWPFAVLGTVGFFVRGLFTRLQGYTDPEKFLLLWVGVHLTMLSTGYTTSRYFLPLLPILYILTTEFVVRFLMPYLPVKHASPKEKVTSAKAAHSASPTHKRNAS